MSSTTNTSGAATRPGQVAESDDKPILPWANPRLLTFGLVAYYALLMPLMQQRLTWAPPVRPASSNPEFFSEERAMRHVEALAGELPDRQISMPQLRKAHDYLVRQGKLLADLAADRPDLDVEVQVHRETVSGSVAMDFGGVPFTNAYHELTNVVVTITPLAAAQAVPPRKGLLIASHHDSAVASPGASDDVSMVAVMLETARALLSRPTSALPAVPLVLLFDGGEESICQAGHGFFNSSRHARNLGAFINLEAMGAGGLPILFQHTGGWTVAAWARGSRNAHGARIAQDVFDTGIIPGDTDYRMFSARHFGTLPGLDIAFIRDSAAYHSHLDNVGRLRRGALQDMGESLLGGLMSLAAALAADTEGRLGTNKALREQSVYVDLLGSGMITYSDKLAAFLHTTPLAMFVMLPMASVASGHTAAGVMGRMVSAAVRATGALLGCLVAPALLGVLRVLFSGLSMSWYSQHWLAYAIFLPVSAAAALWPWLGLRGEALRQRPLQQGHYVACQVYGMGLVLSVLAAGLCVVGLQGFSQVLALGGLLGFVVGSLLDNGAPHLTPQLMGGVLSVCTVPLAIMGAILGTFLDVMMDRMALTGHHSIFLADGIIGALTGCAVLGYSCCCLLPLAGYALGDLFSSSSSGSSSSSRGGLRNHSRTGSSSRKVQTEGDASSQLLWRRLLVTALVAASVAAAAWSSAVRVPYSLDSPRRITITHLHETGSWLPEDDVFPESAARVMAAAVAAAEVHPPVATTSAEVQERPLLPREERRFLAAQLQPPAQIPLAKLVLGIVDSNPWSQLFPDAASLAAVAAAGLPVGVRQTSDAIHTVRYDTQPYEYASLHPLDRLLGKLVIPVQPGAEPLVAVPPYVRKLREETRCQPASAGTDGDGTCDNGGNGTSRVVHLRVFTEAHCWGMLNITAAAPLRAWSLPSAPVAAVLPSYPIGSQRRQAPTHNYFHMVRFSHEAESPFWDLWVELDGGEEGGKSDPRVNHCGDLWMNVELSVTYLPLTPELRAVRDALPVWVAPTWIGTTYHSSYSY